MNYFCRDCGYKGKKRSAEGFCPACGSTSYRSQGAQAAAEAPTPNKWRLWMVVTLWAYLIGHIYWKLYG